MNFTVVLEPQPDGGFTVTVPSLPEIVTEAETEEEAMAMAADAIRLVVGYRRDHGMAVPDDASPTIRTLTLAL